MLRTKIGGLARIFNKSLRCLVTNSLSPQWKPFEENDVKNHVANILKCSLMEATKLVDKSKVSFEQDRSGRIKILQELRRRGFNIKHVSSCKSVLKQDFDFVKERITFSVDVLKDETVSTAMLVLRLNEKDFAAARKLILQDSDKVQVLSEILKKSRMETCLLFIKYPFLIRSKTATLKSKLDFLLENDVSMEDVGKDLWVLTYTLPRLKKRIEEISRMNIHPKKPWMLRCLPETLQRTYQYRHDNLEALGPHPNAIAYLSNRLGVSEEALMEYAKKHPSVLRVNVSKMKEVIDYLMAEGYTSEKIVRTPRIFCHSMSRIQERMNALKERNYQPKVLSVLCKSARSFSDFLSKVDRYRERSLPPSLKTS